MSAILVICSTPEISCSYTFLSLLILVALDVPLPTRKNKVPFQGPVCNVQLFPSDKDILMRHFIDAPALLHSRTSRYVLGLLAARFNN
jgi:hypothetical protein